MPKANFRSSVPTHSDVIQPEGKDRYLPSDLRRFTFLVLTIMAIFVVLYILYNKTSFLSNLGEKIVVKLIS